MDVMVVVAYTLEDAYCRVDWKEVDVRGATVVIDDLTNDVRGTRLRPAVSPQKLVHMVDLLRKKLREAGAESVVVCQLKPMQIVDVSPYNKLLSEYLRTERNEGRGGFGCRTQIRLEFLKTDGFHIRPEFDAVIDRTYACAFLGIPVPRPTPWDCFVPINVRRRWESEWPRLTGVRASMNIHGW